LRLRAATAAVLAALLLAGCGDDEETPEGDAGETATTTTAEGAGLDPAAVEANVEEFLSEDEYAADRSPTVDCGDEAAADQLECEISGDGGLAGEVVSTPSQGFQYTGELETPDGPSFTGGSSTEGDVSDVAAVESRLAEVLEDEPGASAECPEEATGDELECTVEGEGYGGTLVVTPIPGFQWQGELETPDGPRPIAGNDPS
jgi:hypothetical protein